jgi:hypothetical protein
VVAGLGAVVVASGGGCDVDAEGVTDDASAMPTNTDDGGDGAGPIDASGDCGATSCGLPNVPGWRLVEYADTRTVPCPAGLDTQDLLEAPSAAPAACTCTCSSSPSACAALTISGWDDNSPDRPSCDKAGLPASTAPCSPVGGQLGTHAAFAQPSAIPGMCSTTLTKTDTAIQAGLARLCSSPGCSSDVCGKDRPSPFHLCLEAPGDAVPCPLANMKQHVVAAKLKVDCTPCSCDNHPTCTGTFHFYDDLMCMVDLGVNLPATSACTEADGKTFKAYGFQGDVTEACTATSAAVGTKLEPATICCP